MDLIQDVPGQEAAYGDNRVHILALLSFCIVVHFDKVLNQVWRRMGDDDYN